MDALVTGLADSSTPLTLLTGYSLRMMFPVKQAPRENEVEIPVLNLHYSRMGATRARLLIFNRMDKSASHMLYQRLYIYTWGQQYKKN